MDTKVSEDAILYHDGHDTDTNNDFSTRTNTTKRAFLDEVKRFELFRSVIQHEDDLLNQRVSWIILAQSFLMAAFISSSSDGSDALKYITAIVGLLTVVVTMPAILAAGRNIELQQQVYFARISSEERCRELHGHGRNILKYSGEGNDLSISMKEEQHGRKQYGHIFPNMVSKFSVCFLSLMMWQILPLIALFTGISWSWHCPNSIHCGFFGYCTSCGLVVSFGSVGGRLVTSLASMPMNCCSYLLL